MGLENRGFGKVNYDLTNHRLLTAPPQVLDLSSTDNGDLVTLHTTTWAPQTKVAGSQSSIGLSTTTASPLHSSHGTQESVHVKSVCSTRACVLMTRKTWGSQSSIIPKTRTA